MIFRHLQGEEMLTVSAQLLNPKGNLLPILKTYKLLEGPTMVIRDTHDHLLTVQQKSGSNEKRVRQLTTEMTQMDTRHDTMVRGIHSILESLQDLTEAPEKETIYSELRQTLFPKGRSISQRSYREQAGTAKRVERRLTDEDRSVLKSIELRGINLLEYVETWLEIAQTIAHKEAERAELTEDDSEDSVSAAEVRQARINWIRAINSMLNMLEFVDIDERDERILLANLKDATTKASANHRRSQQNKADEPDDEIEDSEPAEEPTAEEPRADEPDPVDEPEEDRSTEDSEEPEVTEPVE